MASKQERRLKRPAYKCQYCRQGLHSNCLNTKTVRIICECNTKEHK